MPDWLGWIPALFSWVAKQGRVVVISGMLLGVAVYSLREAASLARVGSDAVSGFIALASVCISVTFFVVLVLKNDK